MVVQFPGGSVVKNPTCQCRRFRFDHWVGKISWSRKWLLLQYSCLEVSMDRMSTVGCSPWGHKCSDTIDHACMLLTFFWIYIFLSTLFFLLISEWLCICFFNIYFYLFISLNWVLDVAHGILNFLCSMGTLSCRMWDLIPQPGIKPRPLHWQHGVLATEPQLKSLPTFFWLWSLVPWLSWKFSD